MKTTRKKTPKKSPDQALEALKHRIRLQARVWRGDASRRELIIGASDGCVDVLHNCAGDLEGLLAKEA
jgi:hypothetical protein